MKTKEEILEEAGPIIDKLAKSRSTNGSFAYYSREDVQQEVWCMCLEALQRYDEEIGPIENYLVRHVTNRMKNLKRDRYFRPGFDIVSSGLARDRMNLVNALPLGGGDSMECGTCLCGTPLNVDPIDYILCDETLVYIRQRLPDVLLYPFEEMLGNNKVRSPVATLVRQKIAEILTEREIDWGRDVQD